MALNPDVVESVTGANFKNVAEQAAFSLGVAMQNAVAHQKRLDMIAEGYVSQALKSFAEVDPTEAIAQVKSMSGHDLASTISALGSVVASLQQIVKGAQTTPPETGR